MADKRLEGKASQLKSKGQNAMVNLVSSPEDGGLLGSPVVGVLVRILFPLQQCASFCQSFYDGIVTLALHLPVHAQLTVAYALFSQV